jgi:hypothetical protein
MSDPLTFILFFLVFVPFVLIYFQNKMKTDKEMTNLLKETNRLLSEILAKTGK